MKLFKNCEIYAPDNLGVMDVLVMGNRIVAIEKEINKSNSLKYEVINCNGLKLIPGIIDAHVHIAGAGGEGGPATRTPEVVLSQLLRGGITTVIGCLGTDGFTRTPESVLMKVKALRQEGISAWMYTGSYQVPTPTITGEVGKDLALIEEVIGVGEISLSDSRSSCPSKTELTRLAEHARVGAMLGNKSGILNIHMGDAKNPFEPIHEVVANSELNYKQFLPTHCGRNKHIFEQAKEYGLLGYLDFTASSYEYYPDLEIKPTTAILELLAQGIPLEHITMTSDGNGSLPDFDENGNLTKLEIGQPESIFKELIDLIDAGLEIERAVTTVTSNVADILRLPYKGRVRVGNDADLLFLDAEYRICHLLAMGEFMIRNTEMLKKGTYE